MPPNFRNMVVSNGNVDMEEGTLEIGMGMHYLFIQYLYMNTISTLLSGNLVKIRHTF
jgi:hypothetical protein